MTSVIVGITDPHGDFDPEVVIKLAVELVLRHPDAAPVVAQIVKTFIEVLRSLEDDYDILREAS